MNNVGSSVMKLVFSGVLALVAIYLVTVPAMAQTSPAREGSIGRIDIEGLDPLQVSFEFHNSGQINLENIHGKAILRNRLGNQVEGIMINPFFALPGEVVQVEAASQWGFQQPGTYLLEVTLDIGLDALVSKSLTFRITPISLPLSPPQNLEGEGLYTIPQQPVNWGISKIETPLAWQTTHGAGDIVVAVIDSGVDSNIPELARSMWVNQDEIPNNGVDDDKNGYIDDIHGWDFRDNDNSSLSGTSLHWHGTFVAAIIAAWPTENAIVGVAPGVKIMDIRFLDSENLFSKRDWKTFAKAIDYAVDNGARIINLSISAEGKPPQIFKDAILRASQHGVIVVGATGNDSKPRVSYPGKYDSIIAVSATDRNDQLANFSNYGAAVMVAGPGNLITSLIPGGFPATMSGTSFAAPHVTGTLALILSVNPQLTAAQALTMLEESVTDLGDEGHDRQFGSGLIDAFRGVTRASR
jgi:subtilisin family serine protease